MAKELPYFRFTAQEWQNGDISLENYEMKGLFIEICAYYWVKDCSITQAMLKKRFKDALKNIDALIELEIIKVDKKDFIQIDFLNEQFDLLSEKRQKRQQAGAKGGKKRSSNAQAMPKQSPSYKDKDKENNNDKDKDKESFEIFFNRYHEITKKNKTDKEAALKKWKQLTKTEQAKAVEMIETYSKTSKDSQYLKKARTYLNDKTFNDEMKPEKERLDYIKEF